MPSQWTIKASSRGVVVRGDGVIDAFTVGADGAIGCSIWGKDL